MSIEIKQRFTDAVICTVQSESLSDANLSGAYLSGAYLSGANLNRADLSRASLSGADLSDANLNRADLSDAYLSGANLSGADLSGASLSGANLSGADLSGANLSGANLSDANLSDADLSGADLSGANLSDADLRAIQADYILVLSQAMHEVEGLLLALKEGRVDGSYYEGVCACLIGTIANLRHIGYETLNIKPDNSRPAERWFLAIKRGDTPETNPVAAIIVEWTETFLASVRAFNAPAVIEAA